MNWEKEFWINLKTQTVYKVLNYDVTNVTNAQDGQKMILYTNGNGKVFVREYSEFMMKFKEGE